MPHSQLEIAVSSTFPNMSYLAFHPLWLWKKKKKTKYKQSMSKAVRTL